MKYSQFGKYKTRNNGGVEGGESSELRVRCYLLGEKNLRNINGMQFLSPLPVSLLQSERQTLFPLIAQFRKEFVWNLRTQITSIEILCFMRMSLVTTGPDILHTHART